MMSNLRREYLGNGFAIINDVLSNTRVAELREEAARLLQNSSSRGGARNLLHRSPRLQQEGEELILLNLARQILGPDARPTKLTLFNKTPSANWLIRWHQDLTITVRERCEVPGFSSWSLKEDILHVRPPTWVLESIVALRVHLDETPAVNGALKVFAGSHRSGRFTREEIQQQRADQPEVICEVGKGGVMLMSPLLLHASSKSSSPANRRVLHFEYSAAKLPGELEWA